MAQASSLKSAQITALDTIPLLPVTAGEGAPAYLQEIDAYVTCLTGDTTSSIYRLIRLNTNSKIKSIHLDNAALSTSTALNVGVYYSDAVLAGGNEDGTPAAVSGTVVSGAAAFFASAVAAATANVRLDITNQSGSYPINLRNQMLWQVLGLTSDPGGFFDIVVAPSAAVTAGGVIGLTVTYCR